MAGNERVRYCDLCELKVYNLSGMTRRQAEALVSNAEGRLCVRFYRRADGTILTRNCPVGLRALKQRASKIAGATLSAVLGFFAGLGLVPVQTTERHVMGEMIVPETLDPVAVSPVAPLNVNPTVVQGETQIGKMLPVTGTLAWPEHAVREEKTTGRIRRHSWAVGRKGR
jgi:hypothetical protein